MTSGQGPTHDDYVAARRARDPAFARAHDEARTTMQLALGLADLREYRGLTQRALAEKSGIKQPMINRIERGSQTPKALTLLRLLGALNGTLTMSSEGKIGISPAELAPWVTQPGDGEAEASSARERSGELATPRQR